MMSEGQKSVTRFGLLVALEVSHWKNLVRILLGPCWVCVPNFLTRAVVDPHVEYNDRKTYSR